MDDIEKVRDKIKNDRELLEETRRIQKSYIDHVSLTLSLFEKAVKEVTGINLDFKESGLYEWKTDLENKEPDEVFLIYLGTAKSYYLDYSEVTLISFYTVKEIVHFAFKESLTDQREDELAEFIEDLSSVAYKHLTKYMLSDSLLNKSNIIH